MQTMPPENLKAAAPKLPSIAGMTAGKRSRFFPKKHKWAAKERRLRRWLRLYVCPVSYVYTPDRPVSAAHASRILRRMDRLNRLGYYMSEIAMPFLTAEIEAGRQKMGEEIRERLQQLPDWQKQSLAHAVLEAAGRGRVLSESQFEEVVNLLLKINASANLD